MDPSLASQASPPALTRSKNQYRDQNNYLTFENRALRHKISEYEKVIGHNGQKIQEYENIMAQHGIRTMSLPRAQYANSVAQPAANQSAMVPSSSFPPSNPANHIQKPHSFPPGVYPPGVAPSNPLIGMANYIPFNSPRYSPLSNSGDDRIGSRSESSHSNGAGATRATDLGLDVNMGLPAPMAQYSSNAPQAYNGYSDSMNFMPSNRVNDETMNRPESAFYTQGMELDFAAPSSASQIGGAPNSVTSAAPAEGAMEVQEDAAHHDAFADTTEGAAAPTNPETHTQTKAASKRARKTGPVIITTPATPTDSSLIDPRLWELWRQGLHSNVDENVAGSGSSDAAVTGDAGGSGSGSAGLGTAGLEVAGSSAADTSTVKTAPTINNASTKSAAPVKTGTTDRASQGVQIPITRFLNYTQRSVSGSLMAKWPKFRRNGTPRRPWVFGYTFPGTDVYALYYLTCPKPGCPALKNHPLVNDRGAQHIRACGGEFQNEAEMVQRFGTQLATPSGDRPVQTLNWARKWNSDLMVVYGDQHMASENFPAYLISRPAGVASATGLLTSTQDETPPAPDDNIP